MSGDFTIRPFKAEDETAVIDLWETVFPGDPAWNNPADVIQRKLTVQRELFLVCVAGDQVIGTVLAGFDGVRGWVHKVAVDPEFQGLGIATRLMDAAETGLSAMGCTKLNVQVRAANTAAVKFYEDAGYKVEDIISLGKLLS
jgi:ribosomal protein S18 acetylase RimI-like enzyme